MPSVSLLLFCIYSMIFFLLSFQNKLWKLSLPQWDNANEISIPCSTFALLHSMCLFLARSQLYMIMLRIYEKMRMDQSYSFPPLYKITLSFIVHLKVKHDNCFKFLPLETRGEERKGRRKKKQQGDLCVFSVSDKSWPPVLLSPLKNHFRHERGCFVSEKCTLHCVNNILEVREESPRAEWIRLLLLRETRHPLWVAAQWWLSLSLVMSLAALTQVICMWADRAWDVLQRQWCTYHFPPWLIEDCNLCWTFSLITHVSGSKTRTQSRHWAPGSFQGFQPSRGTEVCL